MNIIVAFLEVVRRVAIYHLVPALILSCVMLFLMLGVIKLFRVERPSVRGTLFFIALLKPLFVLIQGTFPAAHKIRAPIAPSLRLPDPINFVPAHLWHLESQLHDVDIEAIQTNMRVSLILILIAAGLFLLYLQVFVHIRALFYMIQIF